MKRRIRCGVLGAGWWATFAHIPALLAHPGAELVAIQKNRADEAQQVALDYGIAHACTTTEELLAIDGMEAVVVSSSPHLHFDQAAAALSAGKHVLIEKPMTLTTAQAAHLVELAGERNLQFLISCPWHYTPHAAIAQKLIAEQELGAVRLISVLMTNPIQHLLRGQSTVPTHADVDSYLHPNSGTYSDPEIAGGGLIYTQVCHVAAYLTFLTGVKAADVFARFHYDGARVDIYDAVNVRMEDGMLASIASTAATSRNLRTHEVRVFGTEGMLYMDLWRGSMQLTRMSGEQTTYPDLAPDDVYPHEAPAKNLIDSIHDERCNRSPATLGLAAIEVVEAACRSAASGKSVEVSSLIKETA